MKARFVLLFTFLSFVFMAQAQQRIPGTIPDNAEHNPLNAPEENGLTELYSVTGNYYLSADGGGANADYTVDANKPSDQAMVHKAYLMSATVYSGGTIGDGCITLDGIDINWDGSLLNAFPNSYNYYADVTSIVGPTLDAAASGITTFDISECNTGNIDGVALLVIFEDPNASEKTIVIMFGAQALTGDTFSIALGESINPEDPGALLNMGLGISYSYQIGGSQQYSIIEVNGERLTTAAGGEDDGISSNGGLMTVGGLGDSNENPVNPFATPTQPRSDDELYSVLPFIDINTSDVSVFTENPSNDDNIFLAYFEISGAAIIGEGILLSQDISDPEVGTDHTITALVQDDNGNPLVGKMVDFEVVSGPNAGTTYSEATDADGHAFFTYNSAAAGADVVQACFENTQGNQQCSNMLTVNWMVPQAESIVLTQDVNTLPIGNMHTVTATLEDELGDPIVDRQVDFEILSGPNAGTTYSENTDAAGQAFFTWEGNIPGVDQIQACFENSDLITQCSNILTFQWTGELEAWQNCIPQGWSLISSPYMPFDPAFDEIFSEQVANDIVVVMLNKDGFWWPAQNLNLLGDWDEISGYKIKLTEEACVNFSLVPVTQMVIDLDAGYNYLPVPVDQGVIAADLFGQLGGDLMFAFDLTSGGVYWPAGGIYTLDVLEPGKAYIVNMMNPGSVDFGLLDQVATQHNKPLPQITNAPWTVAKTGVAHLVALQAQALSQFDAGDIIGAFNQEGACVGMTRVQGDAANQVLMVYGDDISTEKTDGMTESEPISFKVFDASEDAAADLQAVFDPSMPNAGYYVAYGASAVSDLKAAALAVGEENAVAMEVYPNPTTGKITVTGLDAQATVDVMNTQGQVVLSANAGSGASLSLDLSKLSEGVYILKAYNGTQVTVKKIFVR